MKYLVHGYCFQLTYPAYSNKKHSQEKVIGENIMTSDTPNINGDFLFGSLKKYLQVGTPNLPQSTETAAPSQKGIEMITGTMQRTLQEGNKRTSKTNIDTPLTHRNFFQQ